MKTKEKRPIIKKMPNKRTLEEFLRQEGKVRFNLETGEFEWDK